MLADVNYAFNLDQYIINFPPGLLEEGRGVSDVINFVLYCQLRYIGEKYKV